MHLALQISGYGAICLIAITAMFYRSADRPGDDFGSAFLVIAAGGLAIAFSLTWLALVIVKAASA